MLTDFCDCAPARTGHDARSRAKSSRSPVLDVIGRSSLIYQSAVDQFGVARTWIVPE
jgi:hypothetical protein